MHIRKYTGEEKGIAGRPSINPDHIDTIGIFRYYKDSGTMPFLVTDEGRVFSMENKENGRVVCHGDLCNQLGVDEFDNKMAGRIWRNQGLITFWECGFAFPSSNEMRRICDYFVEEYGINISQYTLLFLRKVDDNTKFEIRISVQEYIDLHLQGNEGGNFWQSMFNKQEKTQRVNKYMTNGFNPKDWYRHYEFVGENKIRITETDLRQMVKDCIRWIILRENKKIKK